MISKHYLVFIRSPQKGSKKVLRPYDPLIKLKGISSLRTHIESQGSQVIYDGPWKETAEAIAAQQRLQIPLKQTAYLAERKSEQPTLEGTAFLTSSVLSELVTGLISLLK